MDMSSNRYQRIPDLTHTIRQWTFGHLMDSGSSAFVVGVSGGIDSAVVFKLCESISKLDMSPNIKTIAVSMPMTNTPIGSSTQRAIELCQPVKKNVSYHQKEIAPILNGYRSAGLSMNQLQEGNLRARIRANILYNYAAEYNGLVMGTGNKDEDTIGYFTKYGDGAVDISPIASLHKSTVYKIGKYLGVPDSILDAKPTAELWDNQTDEDELGMNYDEVEWAISMLEIKESLNDVKRWLLICEKFSARDHIVLDKVEQRIRKNAHKVAYPPVFDGKVINYSL